MFYFRNGGDEEYLAGFGGMRDMPLETIPLEWPRDDEDRLRFGPVDAAVLSLSIADRERWFVTFDGRLEARALQMAPERVLPLADIIDA